MAAAVALAATCACAGAAWSSPSPRQLPLPVVDPTVAPNRAVEPVAMTGADFPGIAVPQNATAKAPFLDLVACQPSAKSDYTDDCNHNEYSPGELETSGAQNQLPVKGVTPGQLLGYRWQPHSHRFVQIPFQVDKVFTRYLENDASGFAIYSGADQHTTYQWDREGFRAYPDPRDPCHVLYKPAAHDPIRYFDTNDEVSFMDSDSGPQAPKGASLPKGITAMRAVQITDPLRPAAAPSYVYVMVAAPSGPKPAYGASNGYVRYFRDLAGSRSPADEYVFSESGYASYGNAPKGDICGAPSLRHPYGTPILGSDGKPVIARHRPADTTTVFTPRYKFRYDGRWLMTGISISRDDRGFTRADYGPNLVDRWKARAFAQDPSSKTPCCGFEEEDTHWGGSSTLMGERVGPVRAIRATWGADSGTNVVRMETFYADQVRQKSWLRVHVIPPLDGIYAQWDFRAGRMTRYYNPNQSAGVPVDGRNDTVFGNLDDPCNKNYDGTNEGTGVQGTGTPLDGTDPNQTYRQLYKGVGICTSGWPYHQSINLADPTFEGLNASLQWNETAGPWGTIVDRYQLDQATDATPGGVAQSMMALPYYRDDSCFDDGTGSDPGPRVKPGSSNEPRTYVSPASGQTVPRKCWTPSDGIPSPGDQRYYQGDIGTHGLHLLFQVESDNARQTVPIDEIVSEQRMVMLPGQQGNVGEKYGREFEKPLVVRVGSGGVRAGSVGG
ncbi:MAG: hypothetical protein ACJ764_05140 [Solirubrobacteraceae bacterium]